MPLWYWLFCFRLEGWMTEDGSWMFFLSIPKSIDLKQREFGGIQLFN